MKLIAILLYLKISILIMFLTVDLTIWSSSTCNKNNSWCNFYLVPQFYDLHYLFAFCQCLLNATNFQFIWSGDVHIWIRFDLGDIEKHCSAKRRSVYHLWYRYFPGFHQHSPKLRCSRRFSSQTLSRVFFVYLIIVISLFMYQQ